MPSFTAFKLPDSSACSRIPGWGQSRNNCPLPDPHQLCSQVWVERSVSPHPASSSFLEPLPHPLLAWTTLFIHHVFAKASILPASPVFHGAQIVAELQGLLWKDGLLPWRPGLSDKTTIITWNSNLKCRPSCHFSPGFFTEYHMSIDSLDPCSYAGDVFKKQKHCE